MSSASTTLRMVLLGDASGAVKAMKEVGNETDKTSKKQQAFHKVGHAAGIALAGGLALAAGAAYKSTKAAEENQQSQALLARQLKASTGATKDQTSAAEEWITKQGESLGVTKDELRPALAKLAVATGSVSKAQKLASLAMNVSAGTGKSLTSVAFALAKAQNGNVSGLARLGIKTQSTSKDTVAYQKALTGVKSAQLSYTAAVKAHGKHSLEASIASDKLKQAEENVGAAREKTKKTTLSLDQITKNLSKTYGGAAATSAQTAAGKQKILAFEMQELQVKIGTALIPVLQKLVGVGLKVVEWVSKNTTTVGILLGVLGTLAAVTWAVGAATKAWAAITKIAAAGQWLLNAAMDANPIGLVVIAIAALVVGMVIAYKKSATFRAIVQGAFHGILTAAHAVAGFFTSTIPRAFGKVKDAASTALGWVKSHWPLLLAILTGPIGLAVLVITRNWGKIKSGASAVWGFIKGIWGKLLNILLAPFQAYLRFMGNLPGAIRSVFGGALSWLANAGANLVQGLWNGISSKWDAMMSWLSNKIAGLGHTARKLLGIASPSKVFHQIGSFIVDGLVGGIKSKWQPLSDVLSKVVDAVKAAGDKLKAAISARNSFASGFQSFASSVFGMDAGTDADGNPLPVTARSILANQQAQAKQAHTVKTDVKALLRKGLSKSLIKQLQASGASGMAQLQALASASPDQIRRLNRLNAQTSSDLHSAGMAAGNAIYGAQIHEDKKRYNETKHLLTEIRDEMRHHHGKEMVARIRGGDLEIALVHHKRTQGNRRLAFQNP